MKSPALRLMLLAGAALGANAQAPAPAKNGGVAFHGSLRSRLEIWDWFQGQGNNDYAFLGNLLRFGFEQSGPKREWKLEFAAPVLVGLPDDANAPAPQGDLGLGATYYTANKRHRNAAMVFPKQAYIRFSSGGGKGRSLLMGASNSSTGRSWPRRTLR
jgi:hypothetical protein